MKKTMPTGLGVDATGTPVVDPTANVLSLVEAAVKRLDDLRAQENRRQDDLSLLRERRIDDLMLVRFEYQEKLAVAEAKRIDAIRAVDVGAVAIASERAAQQATVLANQVAASAETLRALVATTATTVAAQLSSVSGQLTERIAVLEKTSYVGSGRSAMSDPIFTDLVAEMKSLRDSRSLGTGKSQGSAAVWGYIVGAIGALLGIGGLIVTMIQAFKP